MKLLRKEKILLSHLSRSTFLGITTYLCVINQVIAQDVFPTDSNQRRDNVVFPESEDSNQLLPGRLPSLNNFPDLPELPEDSETIIVRKFEIIGNTALEEGELTKVTEAYENRPLSLTELYEVRSAITDLYVERGYINSGAYIPPQTLKDGIVQVQVIEGYLETVNVDVSGRLQADYVRKRLLNASDQPFNVNQLLDTLKRLQLNPLIENISANLSTGTEPGSSILKVEVNTADTFFVDLSTNNNRSPSVGSWQKGVEVRDANLFGLGDQFNLGYFWTDGSDEFNVGYKLPINAHDGTLSFQANFADNAVIEEPFSFLDIQSETQEYRLNFRQPTYQTAEEEWAIGFGLLHKRSQTEFLEDLLGNSVPFPSPGADEDGRTRVSALTFSQDWTKQSRNQVIALFSEFSVGLGLFDATDNDSPPDSNFFTWRGQGQWARLLAPETLFLLKGDIQLSDRPLLPTQQIGLGGQQTVRGYRQDFLLTDNGFSLGAELRLPIWRSPKKNSVLQLTPFIDYGHGWNNDAADPESNQLLSLGAGLLFSMGEQLTARIDWGIPLIDVEKRGNSLQDDGVYFSVNYNLF